MDLDEILKKFSVEVMTEISNQTKASPKFILDRFFTRKTAVLGDSVDVIIKRGAGVILESVSPNAEHLVQKTDDAYILTVALPRFPLQDTITASDIQKFRSLNNEKAVTETLAVKIGEILGEQRASIDTTMEFMAVGSLFGKILDGKGNELFSFTSKNADMMLDKTSETDKKTIIQSLNEIDDALVSEFGSNMGYEVLCGRDFLSNLVAKATAEKLFESKEALWKTVDNVRVLSIYGTDFRPYSASYKNTKGEVKQFLYSTKAVVVPYNTDAFTLYYGRALHTEALDKAPTLYFAASPEQLPKGAGYVIVSESRPIPICNRPDAIIKLGFNA